MQEIGFLRSASALFKAIIVPTIMYSSECWYGMTKGMIKEMEVKYHKMMCKLIDVPVSASYSALLSELGMNRLETLIDMQKICYINQIYHQKTSTETTRELLKKDQEAVEEMNNKIRKSKAKKKPKLKESVYDEIVRLCRKHNIPPIFETRMGNETIRSMIKNREQLGNWNDTKQGKYTVARRMPREKMKPYQKYPRRKGRAILLWRCGMLKFRRYWKNHYEARKESILCPHPLCGEDDTMEHAIQCLFMDTKLEKWSDHLLEDDHMVDFIIGLNQERSVRYRRPLL